MLFILSSVIHILKILGRKERKQWQTWQSTYDMYTVNGYNYIKSMQRTKYSLHAVKTHHYLAERPKQNVGLFVIIRPGEILFSPTRRRKLSTFYFLKFTWKNMKEFLQWIIFEQALHHFRSNWNGYNDTPIALLLLFKC